MTRDTTFPQPSFFEKNAFFVEERRGSLNGRSELGIWDDTGHRVGSLVQKTSVTHQFWSIFLSSSLLPFKLELKDNAGKPLGGIRRGWTFFKSRTEVHDGRGEVIGFVKHKYRSRKPRLKVFNREGRKIGEITGNPGNWDMALIDRDYHPFGAISEFDERLMPDDVKHLDTYHISINGSATIGEDRQVMLISAIAIDRLLLTNG